MAKTYTRRAKQVLNLVEVLNIGHAPAEQSGPSPLGQKLRKIRARMIASGVSLLSDDELDEEILDRRGGVEDSAR